MKREYIVELEPGVYLASGVGDPPRTLRRNYARRYPSTFAANRALADARQFRPFADALVCRA
jgi:hypothetical protein